MTEKKYEKQKLQVSKEMERIEYLASWIRNHFPWLVKIVKLFIKE